MERRPGSYDQSASDRGHVRLVATLGTPRPGNDGGAVAFSSDGARVLALGDGSLCIYAASTGRFLGALDLPVGYGPSILDEHGTTVACGRSTENGGRVWASPIDDPASAGWVLDLESSPVCVSVAPGGSWVAAVDAGGTLTARCRIERSARALTRSIDPNAQLLFSPDARRLAVRTGHILRVFSVPDGLVERTRRDLPRDEDVLFHPDGSRLRFRSETARFSRDGKRWARVRNPTTQDQGLKVEVHGEPTGPHVLDASDLFESTPWRDPYGGWVWDLAFHPRDERIALGLSWNQVHVRKETGGCSWELHGPSRPVDWLCADEAGDNVVTLEFDPDDDADVLRIWDVPGARQRAVLVGGDHRMMDLGRVLPVDRDPWEAGSTKQFLLSRDGSRLACLTKDFQLNVFDTQDGRELWHKEILSLRDRLVGFTPNGDVVYRSAHPCADHAFVVEGALRYEEHDVLPAGVFGQSAQTPFTSDTTPLEVSFIDRTVAFHNVNTGISDTIALGSPPQHVVLAGRSLVVQAADLALRVYALDGALGEAPPGCDT